MLSKEPVLLITSSNKEKKGFGTGFAVFAENHTTYVVTCAHVVDTVGRDTVLVNKKPAELVTSIDEAVDIAVLKVTGISTSLLQIGKAEIGTKNTYIKGYSTLDNDKKVLRPIECTLAREISVFTNQSVLAWDLEMTSELPLKSGYSGAPVMDKNSERVIGLAVMRENGGRKGYALSIGEISKVWPSMPHSLLEQLGQNEVDDTARIPFTNRQEELNRLCYVNDDNRLTLYFVVDAPAGYGKSTLLQEVKERYKDKQWVYALVRMKKDATIEDLAYELCNNIELEGNKFNIEKTEGLRQGEQIGGGIVRSLTKSFPKGNGVIILIDLDELPNEKLACALFQDFIRDVERALDRLAARKTQRLLKFYVIIAGRNLIQTAKNYEKNIPLNYVSLSPFKFEHIYDSARQYFPPQIEDNEKKLVAGLALCLGAGHPGCMARIFHHYEKCGLPLQAYLERNSRHIWKEFVFHFAREVCQQMDRFIPNSEVYYLLSLFRYVDDQVLDEIVRNYKLNEMGDGIGFGDNLVGTHLFQRKPGFELIGDSIVRRLITLNLCHTEPLKFVELCKKAQDICKTNLDSSPTNPNFWVLEYLFQCMQEYMGRQLHALDQTHQDSLREEYKQFMEFKVPEIIGEIKRVYQKQGVSEFHQRSKKRSLLDMLKDETQWEFEFVVNYHLRHETFSDAPFNELVKKFETLL